MQIAYNGIPYILPLNPQMITLWSPLCWKFVKDSLFTWKIMVLIKPSPFPHPRESLYSCGFIYFLYHFSPYLCLVSSSLIRITRNVYNLFCTPWHALELGLFHKNLIYVKDQSVERWHHFPCRLLNIFLMDWYSFDVQMKKESLMN